MKKRIEDKFQDLQENSEIAGSNDNSVELIDNDSDNSEHLPPSQLSPSLILEMLPTELILSCLSYLSPKELRSLALVCQSFNELANDNLVWKERLKLDANDLYTQLSHKTEINYKVEYLKENDRKLAEKIMLEEARAVANPIRATANFGMFSARPVRPYDRIESSEEEWRDRGIYLS